MGSRAASEAVEGRVCDVAAVVVIDVIFAHVDTLEDPTARDERCAWLEALCNFELHLRNQFLVDESLARMLAATDLDLSGDDLRLPFASFAVMFTDRYALGLAERTLSREPKARLRGRILRSLTAYVPQASVVGDMLLDRAGHAAGLLHANRLNVATFRAKVRA
jgi:hypothetical protein